MPTICPKCQSVRPEHTEVPQWQCPACGVVYSKAAEARAAAPVAGERQYPAYAAPRSGGVPWLKWLLALALAWAVYAGYQAAHRRGVAGQGVASMASRLRGHPSAEQLRTLAALNQPGDVTMYTADWCPNCHAAKNWMAQYGFKYEQCDIDKDAGCKAQLANKGGDGIPYLVVKGHHMKDGFDSEEFVAALQGR